MKRIAALTVAFLAGVIFISCSPKPKPLQKVYISYSTRFLVAQSKSNRDSLSKKMQSEIIELDLQYKANGNSFKLPDSILATDKLIQPSVAKVDNNDNVYTYIYHKGEFAKLADIQNFATELTSKGVKVTNVIDTTVALTPSSLNVSFVQGWINITNMDSIAKLPDVGHIALVTEPLVNRLTVPVLGSSRIRSDVCLNIWQNQFGRQVKVGVISDDCGSLSTDFDPQNSNPLNSSSSLLQDQVSTTVPFPNRLPALSEIEIVDDGWNGDRYHEGLAMMEIVHDVAPQAKLAFATGLGKLDATGNNNLGMLNLYHAIDILSGTTHCDVITDDLQYLEEPAFEDGPIAQKINEICSMPKPVIYTSAAGNWAKDLYSFNFKPLPNQIIGSGSTSKTHTIHDNKDVDGLPQYKQDINIPPGGHVTVMLQWDDPYMTGTSDDDFDLCLVDVASKTIVAWSTNVQDGGMSGRSIPFESFTYYSNACYGSQGYKLYITQFSLGKNPTPRMKLLILGTNDLGDAPQSKSIYGHTAADSCISCGAMNVTDNTGNYNSIERWSSRGPVEIVGGSPVSPPSGQSQRTLSQSRLKPDVASMEGVSTGLGSYDPFYGTSASAPHVAGIAALLLSFKTPEISATLVRQAIIQGCIDYKDLDGGIDAYGAGRTDAFKTITWALSQVAAPQNYSEFAGLAPIPLPTASGDHPVSRGFTRFNLTRDPTDHFLESRALPTMTPTAKVYVSVTLEGSIGSVPTAVELTMPDGTTTTLQKLLETSLSSSGMNVIFVANATSTLTSVTKAPILGIFKPDPSATLTPTISSPGSPWQLRAVFDASKPPGIIRDWGVYIH